MSGRRRALIVANDEYDNEGLSRLRGSAADAVALREVLGDPAIGGFEVDVVRNQPAHLVQAHIEDLFSVARPDDLLLLHFSCHGLKNDAGELFFAAANTRPDRLASTAVSADFVRNCMRDSRSRTVVLFLDCCYGGAFAQGVRVRAAGNVDVNGSFPPGRTGRGRAVITASSAMQYAFEGDRLADNRSRETSVFTSAVVEGLSTGDADRNGDGWVSLDELYDYVYDWVVERTPHQTPSRDVQMQGDLALARTPTRPSPPPLSPPPERPAPTPSSSPDTPAAAPPPALEPSAPGLPVTAPPVTAPPVTAPPVTAPPVTAPPATAPPATAPPVTAPPVTAPPVAEPPRPRAEPEPAGASPAWALPTPPRASLRRPTNAAALRALTTHPRPALGLLVLGIAGLIVVVPLPLWASRFSTESAWQEVTIWSSIQSAATYGPSVLFSVLGPFVAGVIGVALLPLRRHWFLVPGFVAVGGFQAVVLGADDASTLLGLPGLALRPGLFVLVLSGLALLGAVVVVAAGQVSRPVFSSPRLAGLSLLVVAAIAMELLAPGYDPYSSPRAWAFVLLAAVALLVPVPRPWRRALLLTLVLCFLLDLGEMGSSLIEHELSGHLALTWLLTGCGVEALATVVGGVALRQAGRGDPPA